MQCTGVSFASASGSPFVFVGEAMQVLLGDVLGESETKGKGPESAYLWIRGGVGDNASSASSSESRISSISMNRSELPGGVAGTTLFSFVFTLDFEDDGFSTGVEDLDTLDILECCFGGLLRFLGDASPGSNADAGGLSFVTGLCCICAEGGKSNSSMSKNLCCEAAFWFEGGGSCSNRSMSSNS